LSIDPEVMHGDLCFAGTRVPLSVFLDNVEAGASLEEFLENYPSVSPEHVRAVNVWVDFRPLQAI
ncbi:MAG: DUF433 domain-containing protein, partial [Fimbriimonadaceae bacterium]|nr:DUF433 domain-containing protein [Fimbriimonadaceae bacterium]